MCFLRLTSFGYSFPQVEQIDLTGWCTFLMCNLRDRSFVKILLHSGQGFSSPERERSNQYWFKYFIFCKLQRNDLQPLLSKKQRHLSLKLHMSNVHQPVKSVRSTCGKEYQNEVSLKKTHTMRP